jgi:hypothetical protein
MTMSCAPGPAVARRARGPDKDAEILVLRHRAHPPVTSQPGIEPLTPLAGLVGKPTATPRDPESAAAMRYFNVRIEEELTLDALRQDPSLSRDRSALVPSPCTFLVR